MDWMWGVGKYQQGLWPEWLKDGAISLGQEDQDSKFVLYIQRDPASTRSVPATLMGLGEQGGMVPALTEHRRGRARGKGAANVTR